MSVSSRAVTTAVLAAAVAAGAYLEPRPLPLVGVAALLVILVALGWPNMLRLPAPGGSRLVVLLSGFGAAAATWYTPSEPVLRHLPMIIAISFVLAFLAEMMRRDGRRRLTESVTGTVAGIVVAVCVAGWVAAARTDAGAMLVATAAFSLAIAAASAALPLKGWRALVVAVVAAVVTGGGVATLLPAMDTVSGAWTGAVAGIVVGGLHLLLERLPALTGKLAGLSAATVPVTVTGMFVFVVGRLVVL
ncbi:hypothetical protein [Myceligenerans xiligouense]|uniref:Uncharacterized protein n=1 Tax=Myceligenerans xiligouense TaxID=253184 RepID=A0A3N4YMR0_9MICO|nr:hypothetical protein [Myceligenerans xiligouense]RPF19740.1 hypothetical protein EDD34_0304 [Myceligenerans xiligouense]